MRTVHRACPHHPGALPTVIATSNDIILRETNRSDSDLVPQAIQIRYQTCNWHASVSAAAAAASGGDGGGDNGNGDIGGGGGGGYERMAGGNPDAPPCTDFAAGHTATADSAHSGMRECAT